MSLFQYHTETVNAWTMILTTVASVCATAVISCLEPDASFVFAVFTLSAVLHMPFSVGFHLFTPISISVFNLWRKMDVCAIFIVSILLTFSLAYYVLPWWGVLVNVGVAVAIAVAAVIFFWSTRDDEVLDPTMHAAFVGLIVLCYTFPMVYATSSSMRRGRMTVATAIITVGVFLSLGISAYCYSTGFPQCRAPGRFDVWGHSHQVMHAGVTVAHFLEFAFIWISYTDFVSAT
jgi:adiponectin receptor